MSCAKKPLVSAAMSPRSSEMQNVDPSRIVSKRLAFAAHDPAAARLGERLDHDLVDVHVQRAREREEDAVGDVVRGQRLDALVRRLRRLGVALEADERELGLREARVDRRDPDRAAEEVLAQAVDEAAERELRRDVDGGVLRTPAAPRSSP